ncbi:hypothetical protein [Bartonella sp. F02]|uniref:hypothetical protein n=1 Tax=Bartonella sp. F02 TaxID=2967262 RepID=UPI0022A8E90A|nr:hypothetical protein [Bartonella sp. F02]MCZ2328676.1 hypothetical protein [Bartonella sp. F02]
MVKVHWRCVIILILSVLFILSVAFLIHRGSSFYKSMLGKTAASYRNRATEDEVLERLAVLSPDLIVNLSKMSDQNKRRIIEQARRDAISSAIASGQSDEDARKFGDAVVTAISKAILQPSITNAYF